MLLEEFTSLNEVKESDPLISKLMGQIIGSKTEDFSEFVKDGRVKWGKIIYGLEWLQFSPRDKKLAFFEVVLQSAGICLSCDDNERARSQGFLPLVSPKNIVDDSNEMNFLRPDFPVVFAKIEDAKNYLKIWVERNYSPNRGYLPRKIGIRIVNLGDDLRFVIGNDSVELLGFDDIKNYTEGYDWGSPEEQIIINKWII